MTSRRKPYKTYPKEFKLEAIRLMEESDRQASEIAMQLGIRRNQLYKWKDQSELATLKQEVKRLKEENEILKKAAVFFAKEVG